LCHNTNFAKTDIQDVKGDDLGIVDTDKYVYIMTYSFPCTDLSIAGGATRYGRGQRHKVEPLVGSKTVVKRDLGIATSFTYGKCATGT